MIEQFVNTGKKLKTRIEKLLSTLYLSKFSGTLTVLNGEDKFIIIINGEKAYADRSIMQLSSLPEETRFTLSSEKPENFHIDRKEYLLLDLIFRIVENIDRNIITSTIKPIATEHISIKPEAGELLFLHNHLEPFIGMKRIEIFSNFKKHHRTIFFLLLTRFANVIKSTDEEKEKILEMLKRTNMFDERKDDDIAEDEGETEDEKLTNFLDRYEKFKDVMQLFSMGNEFDESRLHKEYLRIVQKVHPDRLHDITRLNRERAEKFLRIVSENYELLKNEEERKEIIKLMERYGPIKSRTDYARLKEYDEAIFKGTALLRLGNYEAAAEIFDMIYQQTKNPAALEKKILAIWKKSPKWNDFEKTTKYPDIKEDILKLTMIKDPEIEVLFILAEIYEFLKMNADCMKVLTLITKIQPDNLRAKGMKKRLMYYSQLDKKG